MLRKVLALLGCVLVSQAPSQARETAPITLTPATPWNLDYGDDVCSLRRSFGTGESLTILQFQALSPGIAMQMTVAGKLLRASKSQYRVKVHFGPANLGEFSREAKAGLTAQGDPVLLIGSVAINASWLEPVQDHISQTELLALPINFAGAIPADELRATELHVEQGGYLKLLFQTGPMAAPLSALRSCVDDMLMSWGLDPEVQKRLSAKPEPTDSPATWVSAFDLPNTMLSKGESAMVGFRIIVSEDGSPTSCAVQTMTGPREYGNLTCPAVMKRAKFHPAKDAFGQAVKSYYRSSVYWKGY